MDSMDSIDLLHKIAKTPNILGGGGEPPAHSSHCSSNGGGLLLGVPPEKPGNSGGPPARHKLVKQKSLNRTLSTSVLRIKKKRSFWSSA